MYKHVYCPFQFMYTFFFLCIKINIEAVQNGKCRSKWRKKKCFVFSISDVEVESDSILCQKFCSSFDRYCLHNETTSVSYHFFSLPSIDNLPKPAVLLNVTAQGFILIPQMFLHIISGNDERLFDTVVEGERGTKSIQSLYSEKYM